MNPHSYRPIIATIFAAVTCVIMSAHPGTAMRLGPIERLISVAVPSSPAGRELEGRIDIVIERWSTDQELESLRTGLTSGTPDSLLQRLLDVRMRVGFMQIPGHIGLGARSRLRGALNIQFAREIRTGAGRQVIVATDEPLRFGDDGVGRSRMRVEGHEFTLIDIRLDANGSGVGKLSTGAKLAYNKSTKAIEIADFGKRPVWLTEVKTGDPRGDDFAVARRQ